MVNSQYYLQAGVTWLYGQWKDGKFGTAGAMGTCGTFGQPCGLLTMCPFDINPPELYAGCTAMASAITSNMAVNSRAIILFFILMPLVVRTECIN